MNQFVHESYTITAADFENAERDPDDMTQAWVSELGKAVTRDEIIRLLSIGHSVTAEAGRLRAELKLQPESGLAGPYLEAWRGDEQLQSLPLPAIASASKAKAAAR